MHQFDFRWGSAQDPAEGAYSAPQTLQLYGKGRGKMVKRERRKRKEGRRNGKEEGGKWTWGGK